MYILSEWMGSFRQVFLDGRKHPPTSSNLVRSFHRLVRERHPHHRHGRVQRQVLVRSTSDATYTQLHTIERWTRPDAGHLVRE